MSKKLTIDSLKSLFDHFQDLPDTVFWIRDKTLQKQLYLSSSFVDIWEKNIDLIYEHPNSWAEFLVPNDKVTEQMNTRLKSPEEATDIYYQIRANDSIKHIKDCAYILTDNNGNSVGIAGFAQQIPEAQWTIERAKEYDAFKRMREDHKEQVFSILRKELKLTSEPLEVMQQSPDENPHLKLRVRGFDGKDIKITPKEQLALWHLLSGRTAKQTAREMHISPRTVEFHIGNVKFKVGCSNKTALLAHVILF